MSQISRLGLIISENLVQIYYSDRKKNYEYSFFNRIV